MRIKNGLVFGSDHLMHEKDLCFENGVISEHSEHGEYDATGCYVLPGFIDTHIHGANSVTFGMNHQSIIPALDWLSDRGVTGVLVTLASETLDEYMQDVEIIKAAADERVLGIHMEGPFLNPLRKGGMPPDRIQTPSLQFLKTVNSRSGNILKILSMAPELDGIEEVIEYCQATGVQVSMAHTDATYAEASTAVDKGMTRATHLFNAMRPFNHREPGVIGCALTDDRVNCELICDLHHVAAPIIKMAVRAKGINRITMISDGDFFSGLPDGKYEWAGQELFVSDGLCRLKDGTIRGTARTLAEGAKNMFDLGFKPEEIAVMACVNPAKACGCNDRGELTPGKRADIVILDSTFRVKDVFVAGNLR